MQQITRGDVTVTALTDGTCFLPPMFFPGLDTEALAVHVDGDGTIHVPVRSFLVQTPRTTVLVDAGIGRSPLPFPPELASAASLDPAPDHIAVGGRLLDELAGVGVTPGDVDVVVVTHAHFDHVGWIASDGDATFPRATVWCGSADRSALIDEADPQDPSRRALLAVEEQGSIRWIDGDEVPIDDHVRAVRASGHTPGHYAVVISADEGPVWLAGDLLHLEDQLGDQRIAFLSDVDGAAAASTRHRVLEMVHESGAVFASAHLTEPVFRTIEGEPRRWAAVAVATR